MTSFQKLIEQHKSDRIVPVVMDITPALAEEMLSNNTSNRPLREHHVTRLASQMDSALFSADNGETIKITKSGVLADGQHRLAGVVASGETLHDALVVFNVAENSFETIDVGMKRSFSHALSQRGEGNTNQLAALTTWVWRFDHGHMTGGTWGTPNFPTTPQGFATLDAHPEMRASVAFSDRSKAGRFTNGTALSFTHLLLTELLPAMNPEAYQKIRDRAEDFFAKLTSGDKDWEGSPVNKLRERLMSSRFTKYRIPAQEQIALIIKTWNFWVNEKEVPSIVWRKNEPFPIADDSIAKVAVEV